MATKAKEPVPEEEPASEPETEPEAQEPEKRTKKWVDLNTYPDKKNPVRSP